MTPIETSFHAEQSLFSLSVVLFMRKQWCSVRHLDATIQAAMRVWKGVQTTAFIEEMADQTGLELFSMPRQLSTLSHVESSFT